jgi:phosphoglycolate phosphatase
VAAAVAFDLDMTLVDTRRGIRTALLALAAESGRPVDADAIVSRLGPPIGDALSPWFALDELPDAVATFRRHMARIGVTDVVALPGAADALDAVRSAGASVVVVTSKLQVLAEATLANVGLRADAVAGEVWSTEKAQPLVHFGAAVFVGDHPADMAAATTARIPGVGVTTGSSSAEELRSAGAAGVLASLRELPAWLQRHCVF